MPKPAPADLPRFRAVAVKARSDGWTPARQRNFLAALAQTGQIEPAVRAVGMTRQSLARLRLRPGAVGFNRAIAIVIDGARAEVLGATLERAIHGVAQPVYYRGRECGSQRNFNDRLLIAAFKQLFPKGIGF